ncbi:MAG: symmetrical bis(5'-nucleosyl)-tetraphosphatase, partial [Acidobacteria bacterium]|nr:symmetrical bis(5'-nucleosyl)-tetraphosphatase [Acidobacteriota bacterium]
MVPVDPWWGDPDPEPAPVGGPVRPGAAGRNVDPGGHPDSMGDPFHHRNRPPGRLRPPISAAAADGNLLALPLCLYCDRSGQVWHRIFLVAANRSEAALIPSQWPRPLTSRQPGDRSPGPTGRALPLQCSFHAMATFAIGDIHGCFRTLQHLVKAMRFDPGRDRLWLVGDLVNRGPRSLEVLRWVRQLGDRAVCVLGNHDLKLLACGLGVRSSSKNPQLSSILAAPDGEELLAWLGSRPPVHREGGYVLVHAGLLPGWTVDQAIQLGGEIQRRLAGPGAAELLQCLTARNLPEFKEKESGSLRLAAALRAMT